MIQTINTPVSVSLFFNHKNQTVSPSVLWWEGRQYLVSKVGLHHTFRQGRTLYHVYSVQAESFFFRLIMNTDTLFWSVGQISDGEPD